MRAIQAADLTVPGDIAVVGFDDIQVAAVAHPPLTTIRQEKTDLGTVAAETLLRRIESGEDADPHITLPVTLVARQSTLGEQGRNGS
jgi:LacI family transcriptional regulator